MTCQDFGRNQKAVEQLKKHPESYPTAVYSSQTYFDDWTCQSADFQQIFLVVCPKMLSVIC